MIRNALETTIRFVTDHNRVVLLVMLVLTAGMVAGIANLDMQSQAEEDGDALGETTPAQKADYIDDRYDGFFDDEDENVTYAEVYVRDDHNALSQEALLESLHYQQAVTDDEALAGALEDRGILGIANVVAVGLAEDPDADLETQIDALEGASDEEVVAVLETAVSNEPEALQLLPSNYEPGSATAESHRMLVHLEDGDEEAVSDAREVLFETAGEYDDREYFTLGEHAMMEANEVMNQNTIQLILPVALALILGVLAFTYRDLVDVIVGMVGVVASIIWMFGILGWLGVEAGMTLIIGPVLIAGLSIDFGFHVFMRYREQRGEDEAIRPPMYRGVSSVAIAFGLVTVTAAIGFLSNLVNPLGIIRDLGVGITLGVVSAFIIFVTLVPALKISVDGLLEWVGLDRRKRALGYGTYLGRTLGSSVTLARRAAPVVIVLALVAGSAGAVTWSALDQESFQQQTDETPEWIQELPEPLAWEDPDFFERDDYVREEYRSPGDDEFDQSQLLVEGDVTDDDTLLALEDGLETAEDRGIVFEQAGVSTVVSPLSVMETVAAQDAAFAATFEEADTTGDGVPDSDLKAVYDHLYEVAPEEASQVIEQTDEGEYESVRAIVPVDRTTEFDERADDMNEAATAVESGGDGLTATAVGSATIGQAEMAEVTQGILQTLALALGAIFLALAGIYRFAHDSATLGAVTVVPIALVTGLVIGGMYLLEVPLTMLTALLMSLVIGLGIDYNIHISDRFAQELEAGTGVLESLHLAVTGTGGALLGSTLTSAGAFAAILLHPHPQLESFGTMVVLALLTSFLVSVFVLPSMLLVWARYLYDGEPTEESTIAEVDPTMD